MCQPPVDVKVDLRNCVVSCKGKHLNLSRCTFGLRALEFLARRPGYRWTIQEVLDEIWGRGEGSEGTLRTHVSHLRQQLRATGEAEFFELAARLRCLDGHWFLSPSGAEAS